MTRGSGISPSVSGPQDSPIPRPRNPLTAGARISSIRPGSGLIRDRCSRGSQAEGGPHARTDDARNPLERGARPGGHDGRDRSAVSEGQAPHLHLLADAGRDDSRGHRHEERPGHGRRRGGGVAAGYCLEIVNLDDASPQTGKWDGAVEAENANKAVADPLAILYIGTYNSGAAKVSIPITNRAHMAQITPANTYPGLTKKQGAAPGEPEIYRPMGFANYFRPIPADDIQGAVGAKWAKRLGVKKVFILNDQELYGKGIADVFEATAKRIGLPVVANEGIDWKQPDQKPILTKVRASGADLVYLGGVIETGAQVIIRQMKEVGLVAPRVRFMGPDGLLEEELLKGATCDAALSTDMRITFAGLPFEKMRGVGAKTYEAYKAKFGKEPTPRIF